MGQQSAIMPTSTWLDMVQGGRASLSINYRFKISYKDKTTIPTIDQTLHAGLIVYSDFGLELHSR